MELGVGLLLVFGLFARWAALALFFYTLTLALIFHAYWSAPGGAGAAASLGLLRSSVDDGWHAGGGCVRRRGPGYRCAAAAT